MKKQLPAAIFWNESYLWGIWLYKALESINLKVDILSVEELEKLNIENYSVFFVPGGWSSNKLKVLNESTKEIIRKFVEEGGIYFGICGGAGLATEEGLGLVKVKKNKNRVPSFSGSFIATIKKEHPLFKNIKQYSKFYLFYPPDFEIKDTNSVKTLAWFLKPGEDAFSSDLPVVDFKNLWEEVETFYEIPLNPKRMIDKPVLMESSLGKGIVYLSLIHVDTPGDKNGLKILKNLSFLHKISMNKNTQNKKFIKEKDLESQQKIFLSTIQDFTFLVNELIILAERNFLLYRRYPFLYQWRRGIRGLEYLNLWIIFKELLKLLKKVKLKRKLVENLLKKFGEIIDDLNYFIEVSSILLIKERVNLSKGKLTYIETQDEEVKKIRENLFGKSKSYGGLYKKILDTLDYIFLKVLKEYNNSKEKLS